jgi:hypothetical protein
MPYATDLTTACTIQGFDYLLLKSFEKYRLLSKYNAPWFIV